MTLKSQDLILRGTSVRRDDIKGVCLDDIWAAASASSARKPSYWVKTHEAKILVRALQQKVGNSDASLDVLVAGSDGDEREIFAHPILAAAYAGYLDKGLEIEVREVWLRFRSGDAELADNILKRANAEQNRWAGVRALSRAQRNAYTDILKVHGVEGRGYMECTEALYMHLLGGRSFEIRDRMKLKPKANIREHLDSSKLSYVMAAEALAAERIEEETRKGNSDCANATAVSATAIQRAIDQDRKNRQTRFVS